MDSTPSTLSGRVMVHGDSWRWCSASSPPRNEPWKVMYRTEPYLWSPQELYECVGDVPNVAFPCAALVVGHKYSLGDPSPRPEATLDEAALVANQTPPGLSTAEIQEIFDPARFLGSRLARIHVAPTDRRANPDDVQAAALALASADAFVSLPRLPSRVRPPDATSSTHLSQLIIPQLARVVTFDRSPSRRVLLLSDGE